MRTANHCAFFRAVLLQWAGTDTLIRDAAMTLVVTAAGRLAFALGANESCDILVGALSTTFRRWAFGSFAIGPDNDFRTTLAVPAVDGVATVAAVPDPIAFALVLLDLGLLAWTL